MSTFLNVQLSRFLEHVAEEIDIPDHVYEDAVVRYKDVGDWLANDSSPLAQYKPDVFPQGSFRLGTVVRPVGADGEVDIDLVCHLQIAKTSTTQEKLKSMVGDRLNDREDLANVLEESRRCWRLDYQAAFHLDVLPAIPNDDRPPTGCLITDTELVRWQKTNPKAYADWFFGRMKEEFEKRRKVLAEVMKADVADVPDWKVKTVLQRAVQLLKRHRDLRYAGGPEAKPVSIIITTLAARVYHGESDLLSALLSLASEMPKHIERRGDRWWVANPVDPDENFADKWNEKPERRDAFLGWLQTVQQDVNDALLKRSVNEAVDALQRSFGPQAVHRAKATLGLGGADLMLEKREPVVPVLGSTRHCQTPPWPSDVKFKAKVAGGVYRSQGSSFRLWGLTQRSVPKGIWIKFSLDTNVPKLFAVHWQVVNTGKEATDSGDLRGGFCAENGTTHWESTKYCGTHWIQAFVVRNGVCVAKSDKKQVLIR